MKKLLVLVTIAMLVVVGSTVVAEAMTTWDDQQLIMWKRVLFETYYRGAYGPGYVSDKQIYEMYMPELRHMPRPPVYYPHHPYPHYPHPYPHRPHATVRIFVRTPWGGVWVETR